MASYVRKMMMPLEPENQKQVETAQGYVELGMFMGDIVAAKKYLDKAFRLDPKYRIFALDDDDLMSMWMMLGND